MNVDEIKIESFESVHVVLVRPLLASRPTAVRALICKMHQVVIVATTAISSMIALKKQWRHFSTCIPSRVQ